MSKKDDRPKGKLTYCMSCKKDTETVLMKPPGILFWTKVRVCHECGKPKRWSELEQ
jgi:hypothetical protein